jgi:hypothetical protein
MNTFRDFRNFFLVLGALTGGRLAGLAHLKELFGRQWLAAHLAYGRRGGPSQMRE